MKILRADERHRREINALIRKAKLGIGIKSNEKVKNFWFVRKNSEIIATAGIDFHGDVAILTYMVVKEEYRKQGIGSALVTHRLHIAEQKGAQLAALVTPYYRYNFYKRRGFKVYKRVDLPESVKNYWMFTAKRYREKGFAVLLKRLQ